jgi:mRNA interferase YafQ
MLNPVYQNGFQRDVKLVKKRGLNTDFLKEVLGEIINEIPLPEKRRNHKLTGNWKGRWECHITPDWLLIYRLDGADVIFERTGTHSDLF